MIQTSYFAKYKGDNGISIALYTPKWFKGEVYKNLVPTPEILFTYKASNKTRLDQICYICEYKNSILSKLDPKKVAEDLDNKVLLCYEKSGDFCHRIIVAKWLEDNLKIIVSEVE